MPLLEIVRTGKTSPQSVLDLLTLSKAIKKTPVVVGNCTGFAVNRVFFPYTMAAAMLVDLGVDLYRIDRVIKMWGMPMGPFRSVSHGRSVLFIHCHATVHLNFVFPAFCRLADLVGMQVGLAVGIQFVTAFPDRAYKAMLIPSLVEAGRLGKDSLLWCRFTLPAEKRLS